ncbi:MAG: hypothetical protein GSR82_06185 [Desulfurococcales archaeon]|nr:hypothetical protein [Desulfurococcales archaeon]
MSYYKLLRELAETLNNNETLAPEARELILEKARKVYDLLGELENYPVRIENACGPPPEIPEHPTSQGEIYSILDEMYRKLATCRRRIVLVFHTLKTLQAASITALLSSIILAIEAQEITATTLTLYAITVALALSGLSLYKYTTGVYATLTAALLTALYESYTALQTPSTGLIIGLTILSIPIIASLYMAKTKVKVPLQWRQSYST